MCVYGIFLRPLKVNYNYRHIPLIVNTPLHFTNESEFCAVVFKKNEGIAIYYIYVTAQYFLTIFVSLYCGIANTYSLFTFLQTSILFYKGIKQLPYFIPVLWFVEYTIAVHYAVHDYPWL